MNQQTQLTQEERDRYEAREEERFNLEYFVFESFLDESFDIDEFPPDLEFINRVGGSRCAHLGVLPWRMFGTTAIVFIDDLSKEEMMQGYFTALAQRTVFLPMPRKELVNRLSEANREAMLETARDFCPRKLSVRRLYVKGHAFYASAFMLTLFTLAYFYPTIALSTLVLTSITIVLGNSLLRLGAIFRFAKYRETAEREVICTLDESDLPIISILIPLYKEPELLKQVIGSVQALNYPQEKLDIKLVLEADDELTLKAVKEIKLPACIEELLIPADSLRTKPKAMNFSLPFCHGEILGIYDAEDRPHPNQLREVAQAFHDAPSDVATVQCELTFYNTKQNWFTRCFTIEYRIWFSVLLPALQYFKLPVPLGGTSVFFRKIHLSNIGGWDSHNVTEDADLGVRFKRFGYETYVISSKTREEANSRGISWVRQRSRWLKGYMMTWISHMGAPISLRRDLGWRGFWGTQILFLGAFGTYLATPIFWLMWPLMLGYDMLGLHNYLPWLRVTLFTSMLASQVISITVGLIALRNKTHRHLLWVMITLPAYWVLGSLAAYKALFELVFFPFYWDKTTHGFAKEDTH